MGKLIPKYSLHHIIHSKIHDVPCPNRRECRLALRELYYRERKGLIDLKNDTIEQRIDFLIELWRGQCPATVAILEWQKQVVNKFYRRSNY